jgi:hypothetical protein
MDVTSRMDGTIEHEAPRERTRRKRTRFKSLPKPAVAVRSLWEQASEEEKARAHGLSMAILEYWLGKATKGEIARRLELPALRVWQLSQQALSGMLAGLLRQPKRRRRGPAALVPLNPEEDPALLRKRILELERKLSRTEDLVRVLRDLPWAPKRAASAQEGADGSRERARRVSRTRRGEPVSTRDAATNRTATRRGSAARRAGDAGEDAGSEHTHAAQLEAPG